MKELSKAGTDVIHVALTYTMRDMAMLQEEKYKQNDCVIRGFEHDSYCTIFHECTVTSGKFSVLFLYTLRSSKHI